MWQWCLHAQLMGVASLTKSNRSLPRPFHLPQYKGHLSWDLLLSECTLAMIPPQHPGNYFILFLDTTTILCGSHFCSTFLGSRCPGQVQRVVGLLQKKAYSLIVPTNLTKRCRLWTASTVRLNLPNNSPIDLWTWGAKPPWFWDENDPQRKLGISGEHYSFHHKQTERAWLAALTLGALSMAWDRTQSTLSLSVLSYPVGNWDQNPSPSWATTTQIARFLPPIPLIRMPQPRPLQSNRFLPLRIPCFRALCLTNRLRGKLVCRLTKSRTKEISIQVRMSNPPWEMILVPNLWFSNSWQAGVGCVPWSNLKWRWVVIPLCILAGHHIGKKNTHGLVLFCNNSNRAHWPKNSNAVNINGIYKYDIELTYLSQRRTNCNSCWNAEQIYSFI